VKLHYVVTVFLSLHYMVVRVHMFSIHCCSYVPNLMEFCEQYK